MKAMMSEKLRNILNNPQKARELQRQLCAPRNFSNSQKSGVDEIQKATSSSSNDSNK